MFYIGFYRGKRNIFLSESIWPRTVIFDKQHHLVFFYQVCSNYALGAKNVPVAGVTLYLN